MAELQNHEVRDCFERVTRLESRAFKPYSVPRQPGCARMHQNESPLSDELRDGIAEKWSALLKKHWQGSAGPNEYPELGSAALRKAYASSLGLPVEEVEVFSGSSEALYTLASGCFSPRSRVAFFDPSFSLLSELVQLWGARKVPISLGARFEVLEESLFSEEVLSADVCVLCTPNNPTGQCVPAPLLERFLETARGLVVVDEAYFEFARFRNSEHKTWIGESARFPNVLVLRTLSKAWGSAGLRVGALVGHPFWVSFLGGLKRPYSIAQASEICAVHALQEKDMFLSKIVSETVRACEWLEKELRQIPGLEVYESQANFVLFRTEKSQKLAVKCASENILVRQLPNNLLRVSPWSAGANRRFIEIVRKEQNA